MTKVALHWEGLVKKLGMPFIPRSGDEMSFKEPLIGFQVKWVEYVLDTGEIIIHLDCELLNRPRKEYRKTKAFLKEVLLNKGWKEIPK